MTATNVTQAVGALFGAAGVNSPGAAGRSGSDGFSQIMNRTKDTAGQMQGRGQEGQIDSARTPVKVNRSNVRETASSDQSAEDTTKAETDQNTADNAKDPQTAVEEAIGEVTEAIEEELGISEEELEAIMSELGLVPVDLLQPENVQAIVMAAAGETDGMSILTNESLYQSVQTLTGIVDEIVSDVQTELGMDDAAFAEMLQQMEATEEIPESVLDVAQDNQEPVVIVSGEKAEEAVSETETQQTQTTLPEAAENTSGSEKETVVPETAREKSAGEERQSGAQHQENGNPFLQGWDRSGVDVWRDNAVSEPPEIPFAAADTTDVMNQVTEYMKLEARPDMTELELRLHPESLGTLHIHLSAKEGVITAQFTAENEAVRNVLEAQAIQLKENLNEQGVKVEAVEVTIASHGFERSFAENGEDGAQYEEPKKRGTRRIQLNDDVSLDEMDLSDEERIAAEMMEQNGNTVDYTV